MSKFVGCLIGFQCWLVVNFTGSKCGKGKLIEAFVLLSVRSFKFFRFKSCFVVERLCFVNVESEAVI